MIRSIPIGQYLPMQTPIHRLDPRTKLLMNLFFVIALFIVDNFIGYVVLAIALFAAIILARIPISLVLKSIRSFIWIILITLLLNVLFTDGTIIAKLGPVSLTREGYISGLEMAARLGLVMISAALLTMTASPLALTDAIESLLNPFRKIGIPAHELAMMMTIALRFVPTLIDETEKIIDAQVARGADFYSGSLVRRTQMLIPLMVPLFISAFRRADELAMAMEARVYLGGEGRTRLNPLSYGTNDLVAGLISIGVILFAVIYH